MAIPTATEIRANLEGYNITTSIMSDAWIEKQRDNVVIPFVNNFIKSDIETEQTVVEYLSGIGRSTLILNKRGINSLVSVQLVSGADVNGTLNLSSIQLLPEEGMLKIKSLLSLFYTVRTFPKGEKNIKVTYKIGGSCPDEIKQAIENLTNIQMLKNIEGRTGGGSINTQGWSRDFGNMGKYSNIRKTLNQDAMGILRRYSTAVVGS